MEKVLYIYIFFPPEKQPDPWRWLHTCRKQLGFGVKKESWHLWGHPRATPPFLPYSSLTATGEGGFTPLPPDEGQKPPRPAAGVAVLPVPAARGLPRTHSRAPAQSSTRRQQRRHPGISRGGGRQTGSGSTWV